VPVPEAEVGVAPPMIDSRLLPRRAGRADAIEDLARERAERQMMLRAPLTGPNTAHQQPMPITSR